ncbi:mitochondrial 2-oxoglutarate/malate carrier protein-like, partial [Ceratina calcarata]
MDVVKIRMQIAKTPLITTIGRTYREVGFRGFYLGWTAAMLRQLTYTTARLGMYHTLYDLGQNYFGHLNYLSMIGIGMLSGVVGAFVGTPSDVVLIRMISDIQLPPEKRRNYRNAITGVIDIGRKEGLRGLWRGAVPTMTRAAIVNGSQLGTYSKVKIMLIDTGLFQEGVVLSFMAAMLSGLVMSLTSLPVDLAKTRIQSLSGKAKPPGILQVLIHIVKMEGIPALWRGFLPYYARAAPNAVVTLICLDGLRHGYFTLFVAR